MKTVAFICVLLGLSLCSSVRAQDQDCTQDVCTVNDDSLRFFVLGDFGGQGEAPFYTQDQMNVAKSIAKMGEERKTHFQMELGDNFYTFGVYGIQDPRFNTTFRFVYNGSAAMYNPWYIIAGNHDHFPFLAKVEAEVEYSNNETRWKFPSLYYQIQYELKDGTTIDFIMIDTIVLCGVIGLNTVFPFMPSHIPPDFTASEVQWQWIEHKLQQSQADYLFVAGHYPVYSIAEHGPDYCLNERLEPMLHKYKVSAYMNGHDHTLQHLQYDSSGWLGNYIVSGAAAKTTTSTKHKNSVPSGSSKFHYPKQGGDGGFVYAQLDSQAAAFSFHDGMGQNLYQFSTKPRN